MSIEFTARAVAPLAIFMAKQDARYYLNGICIMPSPVGTGAVLAATDGHRMALWHDEAGQCDQQTILRLSAPLISTCKARSKFGLQKTIKLQDGRLVVHEGGENEIFIQAGKAEIDGKYPNIWAVVPKNDTLVPGLHGAINADYLKDIGTAARIVGGNDYYRGAPHHYSAGTDGNGVVLTRIDGIDNFVILTMALRANDKYPHASPVPPRFIKPEPAKDNAATAVAGQAAESCAA